MQVTVKQPTNSQKVFPRQEKEIFTAPQRCVLVMQPFGKLTCPVHAVLFSNFSTVSQKHSDRLQVAQRHSQVQRGPTSGVHSLNFILEDNQ